MFKIDWPCAICGTVLGYYTRGRVEATKKVVKKISSDAIASLKESFTEYEKPQASQGQSANKKTGN